MADSADADAETDSAHATAGGGAGVVDRAPAVGEPGNTDGANDRGSAEAGAGPGATDDDRGGMAGDHGGAISGADRDDAAGRGDTGATGDARGGTTGDHGGATAVADHGNHGDRDDADPDRGLELLFRAEFVGLVHTVAIVVGDVDAASDVVQEAFLQASRHWARVARYENPAAWLRRVAVNRALDERRRNRRHLAALPRLARLGGGGEATGASEAAEPAVDFDAAVARLPRQQRAVVALFYGADLPLAEIAGVLGIAEGTVKSHLHDARRALAPQLEVDDGHR